MSRTVITVIAAVVLALSLSACGSRHPGAAPSARPHPTASHSSGRATPPATASPTPVPVAALSTSTGDELLTFSGSAHSANGSTVALTFTLHSPVPWNGAGGTSTLAALTAAGSRPGDPRLELLDPAWDAANGVSLAVVDYAARMTAGSWVSGQTIELDLGPDMSEVPLSTTGLTRGDNGPWYLTGPGSGRIVIAFTNSAGAPDPSTWGDQLQTYGFAFGLANYDAPDAYQLADCRLSLTALGQRPAAVAGWFTPTSTYCSAGIGD
jgi:hypothetical protein